nr:hypothetical protein [Tanacetum cinerariifolium]
WPPRVTLGRLLPHTRGLGFKPRRGGFPSEAKKEWGLSPKAKVRVLHTAQLDVTSVAWEFSVDAMPTFLFLKKEEVRLLDFFGTIREPAIFFKPVTRWRKVKLDKMENFAENFVLQQLEAYEL